MSQQLAETKIQYEVFSGTKNAMELYSFGYARVKALNPNTMRYISMDKGVIFKTIQYGKEYKLVADVDIRTICKQKGYIL